LGQRGDRADRNPFTPWDWAGRIGLNPAAGEFEMWGRGRVKSHLPAIWRSSEIAGNGQLNGIPTYYVKN
jgi:hypothetical protein